jgi:hypothetical protein
MDKAYVLGRVNTLQRELLQIAEHNRDYFTKETHSANERAQHEAWRERVYEIRAELFALMERTAA